LLYGVAIAIVAVLLDLLLCLTVGWIRNHIVRVGRFSRRLLRAVHRLNALWRFGHDVFLRALLVRVIRACREEEQRAAQPDLFGVIRQVANANPARWRDHHITRTLRAIPVASRVEIIAAAIRHSRVAARHAIYLITRTIARA